VTRSLSFGCRGNRDRIGVLVAQLGTPDAPTEGALRPYLKQFLSDPRVIEKNRFLWWFILNAFILRSRPARSAALYKRIWGEEGSPLLTITRDQAQLLQQQLGSHVEVVFGMRYGSPSLESAIDTLIERGCTRILLFPMYPHYAGATTASTYDAVFRHLLARRWVPTLRVAEPYYHHRAFLDALAVTINEAVERSNPIPSHVVLSYHGVPEAYIAKGDPYCCMCTETTAALLPLLRFEPSRVIHTYQSRFGRDPWLTPYTDETIESLAKEGTQHIAVAAPGFTADCLETLDELGNEGAELFKEHGGISFTLIPCLNTHPRWIEAMAEIVKAELGSWLTNDASVVSSSCGTCPAKVGGKAVGAAR
jgi:protoporphyrin/coproporphyrin ferrochelatase